MVNANVKGSGTREDPWLLNTPSGSSEFQMYRDEKANPPALVCLVGKTELPLPVALHQRPAGNAQSRRRMDASR